MGPGAASSPPVARRAIRRVRTVSASPLFAEEDVSVRGYYKSDGTYVQPHMRSAPDSIYNNNWSTYPTVNPYTGQQGTRQPV